MPEYSNNLGYILMLVKPGTVFISFIYILLFLPIKKSTFDKPKPSTSLKAFMDRVWISLVASE